MLMIVSKFPTATFLTKTMVAFSTNATMLLLLFVPKVWALYQESLPAQDAELKGPSPTRLALTMASQRLLPRSKVVPCPSSTVTLGKDASSLAAGSFDRDTGGGGAVLSAEAPAEPEAPNEAVEPTGTPVDSLDSTAKEQKHHPAGR